jgi:GTP-binding protein
MYQWEIPITLIFTKSDKEKPGVVARNVKAMLDTLKEHFPFLPEAFVTSAEKKEGVAEVITCLDRYNQLYKDETENK